MNNIVTTYTRIVFFCKKRSFNIFSPGIWLTGIPNFGMDFRVSHRGLRWTKTPANGRPFPCHVETGPCSAYHTERRRIETRSRVPTHRSSPPTTVVGVRTNPRRRAGTPSNGVLGVGGKDEDDAKSVEDRKKKTANGQRAYSPGICCSRAVRRRPPVNAPYVRCLRHFVAVVVVVVGHCTSTVPQQTWGPAQGHAVGGRRRLLGRGTIRDEQSELARMALVVAAAAAGLRRQRAGHGRCWPCRTAVKTR